MRQSVKVMRPEYPAFDEIVWCDICGVKKKQMDRWNTEVLQYDEPFADICNKCYSNVLVPFIKSHNPRREE